MRHGLFAMDDSQIRRALYKAIECGADTTAHRLIQELFKRAGVTVPNFMLSRSKITPSEAYLVLDNRAV